MLIQWVTIIVQQMEIKNLDEFWKDINFKTGEYLLRNFNFCKYCYENEKSKTGVLLLHRLTTFSIEKFRY